MAQENKHEGEEGQDLLVVEEEEEEKKKHRSMVVARGILGTIEMFIKGRGYGFLKRDDTGEELFFHRTDIITTGRFPQDNLYALDNGNKVQCNVILTAKGPRAVSISQEDGSLVPILFRLRHYQGQGQRNGNGQQQKSGGRDSSGDEKQKKGGKKSKGQKQARRDRDRKPKEVEETSDAEEDPKTEESSDNGGNVNSLSLS